MAQQEKQTGCFKFRKGRGKRVEPDGEHNLRNEQNGPPSDGVQPSPSDGVQPSPSDGVQPSPSDGVQPSPVNTDNRGRSSLGEGEGRINLLPDKEFREQNDALRIDNGNDEEASQLKTVTVNFHKDENREAHKTDDYEIQQLIVRRGQAFDVSVTFNRDYNPEDDIIVVQFVTGKRPQESKGSIVRVAFRDSLTPTQWGMQVREANGSTVHLSIISSAKAIICRYEVFIETKSKNSSGETSLFRYKHEEQICVLFNAWCSEDAVFMENDAHRNEYVMEDFGYIWKGVSGQEEKRPWTFGQFEDVTLNCALWLLDKAELSCIARTSPIQVVRTISAMANSNDKDGGVLSGRWSNSFPEGTTPPLAWTGSTAILEQFWRTKKTVRYGQCWVFSGVVTALSRALGIPTRSVTNFDSAHDSDGSMTIDSHFDEEGDLINHMNDSVWNYHVWNESWFKRPDLPHGHDGWQAFDATPQETSGGVFRCGPASVVAVKKGEVYLPYDTGFVFAEVNGDRVYWDVEKTDGSMKATNVDKNSIGNSVSTKTPGSDEREDITHEYKYPEGSEEERDAVKFAFQFSSRTEHEVYKSEVEDVNFRLDVEDIVYAGNSFDAAVVVENNSEKTKNIKVNFAAVLSFYTGVPAKKLKGYKLQFLLHSKAEKRLVLTIEPNDYITKSGEDATVKLYVKGKVEETGQSFATQDVVELTKPKLKVTASSTQVKIDEDVEVTVSFTNPLSTPLIKGQFHLEATRMKPKSLVVDCKSPVDAKEEAKITATFTAARKGKHHVAISFQSNELTDVHGECTISETEAT
ncbi:hypothetical protein OS493_029700 [Desmophyllum pertusum]|uniref:protein-glutamine gamma-glutamyltransferase n=1 Tax=Desmophyllum pertusum TaxID=174260 RepID=A0A9W9Z8W7_9CNID|nr:hypothetical protein OS493_029700 [Desmophyllum pertusum]